MSAQLRPGNWTDVEASVAHLASLPGMTAGRIARILEHDISGDRFAHGKYLASQLAAEQLGWPRYSTGCPMYTLSAVNGQIATFPAHILNEMIVPAVIDQIGPETDAVMELGCGYGRHLFVIRDLVEHEFPHLRYFGGELSESGLAAARTLASLEPGRAPVGIHAYNHLDPCFDFLSGLKNVVFFSSHSLEQVTTMTDLLFIEMMAAVPNLVAIHDEPVGWQFNDELMASIRGGTYRYVPVQMDVNGPVNDHYSAAIPVASSWNTNLVDVLRDLQKRGLIAIKAVYRDFAGAQLYNPTTRIVWTRA